MRYIELINKQTKKYKIYSNIAFMLSENIDLQSCKSMIYHRISRQKTHFENENYIVKRHNLKRQKYKT